MKSNWSWIIGGVGILLWGGFLWNLVIELRTLSVVWPPLVAFLLGTGLSAALVYAAFRFNREDWIDSNRARRIVGWGIGGLVLVTGLRALTIGIRIAEGRSVAEPELDILVSLGGGMLAGVLAGFLYERTEYDAETVRETKDAVNFLNRTIRHECLNGLTVIQGNIDQVRDHLSDNDLQKNLNAAHSRAVDMTDMIQNVRMFMHTYTGQKDLRATNLSDILADRVSSIQEPYPDVSVQADIPPDVYIRANEGLKFVFKNLIENAIEHNDKPTPEVTVDVETSSDTVTVSVADNGPGIPPEKRERVFEPDLEREHRFGLYLVKTLVNYYDCEIDIADNEPEGTVVTIECPRQRQGETDYAR